MAGVWVSEHQKKFWTPYIFWQLLKPATTNLVHKLGLGLAYQKKTMFRTKIGEVWPRAVSKKFGTPCLFLQPLKPATSNLVHNLGLGVAYKKHRLRPKLEGVLARGASKKCGNPYLISATVEAIDFKFGTGP